MASLEQAPAAEFDENSSADVDLDLDSTDTPTHQARDAATSAPRVGAREATAASELGHGDSLNRPRKPPNVLIYTGKKDTERLFDGARKSLSASINPNMYVIYNLKHDKVATDPWSDNAVCVVIATDRVYDDVSTHFLDYFRSGGVVVSFSPHFNRVFCERVLGVTSGDVTHKRESVRPVTSLSYSNNGRCVEAVAISSGSAFGSFEAGKPADDVMVEVIARNASEQAVIVLVSHPATGLAVLSQVKRCMTAVL